MAMTLLAGCSVLTMRAPRVSSPAEAPRCSEGRGPVVIDGLMTALFGVGAILAINGDAAASLSGGMVLLGSAHLGSAIAGSRWTKRCTRAHEAHAAWIETAQLREDDREPRAPATAPLQMPGPVLQTPAQAPAQAAEPSQRPETAGSARAPRPGPATPTTAHNPWADFWVIP